MAIVGNKFYNSAELGSAFESIAGMFAPPDASDLAAYSTAAVNRQKVSQLGQLFDMSQNPNFNKDAFDRMGQATGQWSPSAGYYGVDQNNLTSRANNAADNQRSFITSAFSPLSEGQVRPTIPDDITSLFGVEGLPAEQGNAKPLSETEVEGDLLLKAIEEGLVGPADAASTYKSDINVEEILGESGPQIVTRADAIGETPAPSSPLVNIGPNGEPLGDPGDGLVWKRGADGKPVLDERGAPIAIPFEGGKVWAADQAAADAAAKGGELRETSGGVVVQDIDRALEQINANPFMTTGPIGQWTSGTGGFPAHNVAELVRSVRSNIGFDKLQAMREASPTGGALGQVAVRELDDLQASIGSLAQSQDLTQFSDNLKRVKNIYLDIIHGSGNGPRERLSFDSEWGPALGKDDVTNGTTQPPPDSAPGGDVARPQTDADYNALPPGALFIDPDDGKTYRKP